MTKNLHFAALLVLLSLPPLAAAQDAPAKPADPASPAKPAEPPVPEAKTWVTKHRITMGGAPLAYTATAGTMLIRDEKDEPVALFGYTAYTKDGTDRATRPILFAYNGGPGSASAWLHVGVLGPKRTQIIDLEPNTRGPFRLIENDATILDRSDLVMIDPVGTGFSRTIGKGEGKDFWGVDQDARSVADFIVRYLNQNGRWSSPKYILGESYGGMRSGAVAYVLLARHNVTLNGVILVSPFMDAIAGNPYSAADTAYVNFLTTYASTAWYHKIIPEPRPDLQTFLRQAEAFVRDVYAPVLFKGARATAEERRAALEGLTRFTGVSADYWDRANLRMNEGQFLQELLRTRGLVVGRIDTRYTGGNLSSIAALMGTPFEIDTRGAILFLEDVNEDLYRIDRMLAHLRMVGALAGLRGVLIGRLTGLKRSMEDGSFGVDQVLAHYFSPLGVPVLYGLPIGHIDDQWTMPVGVRARVDADAASVELLEAAVA